MVSYDVLDENQKVVFSRVCFAQDLAERALNAAKAQGVFEYLSGNKIS